MNKKAIEALIKCGAFGSTGASRKGMLLVLEQAQAAGQKAQQDAAVGQSSIFDLGLDTGGGENGAATAFAAPSHAPIPAEEFERGELLAAEKESIGLFISAHPLKEVGAALQAKADCALGELQARRDGDWVTIGGMITQAKKIRTKKGDPMMFATLDDLSATIEVIVFGNALAGNEAAMENDSIVLIRGRVDHKDKEKTVVIVQQVEQFDPSPEEVQRADEAAAKVVAAAERAAPVPRPRRAAGDDPRRPARRARQLPRRVRRGHRPAVHGGRRRLRLGPRVPGRAHAGLYAELDRCSATRCSSAPTALAGEAGDRWLAASAA